MILIPNCRYITWRRDFIQYLHYVKSSEAGMDMVFSCPSIGFASPRGRSVGSKLPTNLPDYICMY